MPRLSTTGAVGSGFNAAAGELAVTGTAILPTITTANKAAADAQGPAWLTSTLLAFYSMGVSAGGPLALKSYDTGTTTQNALKSGDITFFGAGAGIWATYIATLGVDSNLPGFTAKPLAVLGDVATDTGHVAILDSAATGQGLRIYSADGTQTFSDPAAIASLNRVHCRAGLVTYNVGTSWKMVTAAGGAAGFAAQLDPAVNVCVPASLDGFTYVLERTFAAPNDVLTLRLAGSGSLWTMASGAAVLSVDVMPMTGGILRVVYSTTNGETASSVILRELVPATNQSRRGTLGAGVISWEPWAALTPTTVQVGPVDGSASVGANTPVPPQNIPFVDKDGKLTTPALAWARSLDGATATIANAVNQIPAVVSLPGFEAVASPGQPSLAASVSPILNVIVTDGLTVSLNPATNTVVLGQRSGRSPLSESSDDSDPMFPPPGRRGADGAAGRDGKTVPAVSADDDFPVFGPPARSRCDCISYVPVSTGAEPLVIMSNGAGSVLLTPFTP